MNPDLCFDESVLNWLLRGDVSIQYQVYRDLLGENKPQLRQRIATEGWGAKFMSKRKENGHWGKGFYQPKWTSSHYTLLNLKHLEIPVNEMITETIQDILEKNREKDGGLNPAKTIKVSDVCIQGMFLQYATFFNTPQDLLESIVDFLINVQMDDGGFNCQSNRKGAVHSSLHSTISVLEGLSEYKKQGYTYRLNEIERIIPEAIEFILLHRLYKSDHTGEIIDKKMLMLSYPYRWRYNILRCLDYFRAAGIEFDPRMVDALDVLMKKRRRDGRWPVQARHPGKTHLFMEKTGYPSRWNTLIALRVLKHFPEYK
ncbi:hypothetical protein GF326_12925 [Candidatus Bathyarchaeota archaeon]|nr:hypothetical protein [Candidatus Bathyarchaeota archaeon]